MYKKKTQAELNIENPVETIVMMIDKISPVLEYVYDIDNQRWNDHGWENKKKLNDTKKSCSNDYIHDETKVNKQPDF